MAYDAEVREAFFEAAADLERLAGGIDAGRLDDLASEEWTVRELLAHTMRAFLATQTVLSTPVDPATRRLDGAAAYFRAAFEVPGVHQGILERAREGAAALGEDPAPGVHDALEAVRPRVERTELMTEVQHFAGRLAFGDYLVTRVAELVLHSVDLDVALGMPIASAPRPARIARDLVLDLSDRAEDLAVACLLTGRPWPSPCNVLA